LDVDWPAGDRLRSFVGTDRDCVAILKRLGVNSSFAVSGEHHADTDDWFASARKLRGEP
jgi:hypothetical protein